MSKSKTRIPQTYIQPGGLPHYWHDESSGELARVITKYIQVSSKPICKNSDMTQEEIDLVREYFDHWISAPCWDEGESDYEQEFNQLRIDIKSAKTILQLKKWVSSCLKLGIDPI